MIITDKHNCRVQTIKKAPQAHTAPKSTFYADFKVCLALEGTAGCESQLCPMVRHGQKSKKFEASRRKARQRRSET